MHDHKHGMYVRWGNGHSETEYRVYNQQQNLRKLAKYCVILNRGVFIRHKVFVSSFAHSKIETKLTNLNCKLFHYYDLTGSGGCATT
jgi:hypothetical protein